MKCPFCAEEIKDEAIKCKHCGEWLESESNSFPENESKGEIENPTDIEQPILIDYSSKTKSDSSNKGLKIIVIAALSFVGLLVIVYGLYIGLYSNSETKWVNTYVGDNKPRLTVELPGELQPKKLDGQEEYMQLYEYTQAYEYSSDDFNVQIYNYKIKTPYIGIIDQISGDLSTYIHDILISSSVSNVQIINTSTTQIKGRTGRFATVTMDSKNQKYNDDLVLINDAGSIWVVEAVYLNGDNTAHEWGKRVLDSVSFEY